MLHVMCMQMAQASLCAQVILQQEIDLQPSINGWGLDLRNTRFVSAAQAGVNLGNISRTDVDWVFALPDTQMPHAQPMVTANTVYIGDESGVVYALDRQSGCTRWTFAAEASIRTAISLVDTSADTAKRHSAALLIFGDAKAYTYAINASTGQLAWKVKADTHEKAMISGSPVHHGGRVFVPVSSWEAFWAMNPFYACCTFRSSVLALDLRTGDEVWRTYTVSEIPKITTKRFLLPDLWGPSGAPVWSAPTIDALRNVLYVGTGENYSSPATAMSDAIVAMNLDTGAIEWHQQFLSGDAWNVSCANIIDSNCPEERGVDLDFGAPPILANVGDHQRLLVGQKNGVVRALDPDEAGRTLWARKLGRGGKLGGIHFGMAVDERKQVLYVPISDRDVLSLGEKEPGIAQPGLHALDIHSGETLWYTPADPCNQDEECLTGLSAAITITEDVVFAAALDGVLHAFDVRTGERVWRFDTATSWESVNGVAAGGSVDLGGVYLSNGQIFVSSGYDVFDQRGGNAFMVLRTR